MRQLVCYVLPVCITYYAWIRWSPWIAIPIGLGAHVFLSFAFFATQAVFGRITGRAIRIYCDKCSSTHLARELGNRGLFRGKMTNDYGEIVGAVFECPQCGSHILHDVLAGGDRVLTPGERSEHSVSSTVEVEEKGNPHQMAVLLRELTIEAKDTFNQASIDEDELWAYIAFMIGYTSLGSRSDPEEINTFFNIAAIDYGGPEGYSELFELLERRWEEYGALFGSLDVSLEGAFLHAMKTVSVNITGTDDLASTRVLLMGITADVASKTKKLLDRISSE